MDLTGINLYLGSVPATKHDMAQKHKNCTGSNAFPKSHVCWAQGAEHAQQQLSACSLVKKQQPGAGARCQYSSCHLSLLLPVLLLLPWRARGGAIGQKIYSGLLACSQLPIFSARALCWERDLKALRKGVSGSELQVRQVVLAGTVSALLRWSLLQLVIDTMVCLVYSWLSVVATTENSMRRIRSSRLGRGFFGEKKKR